MLPLPPWKTRNLRISGRKGGFVQRFGVLAVEFLFGVFLMFSEEFRMETHVAWFVDAMDVSKGSGNGEIRPNLGEIVVYVPDIFGLGVQGSIIHAGIVNAYSFR